MDEYLTWCNNYLKGQGFWFGDFGNYCFGSGENTVGISISKKDDYLHISTIKFPECNNSPSFFICIHPKGIDQIGTVKLLLDVLIFTIKSYEQ